jgi:SAM-dependent MidA family methyltransferase
MKPIQEPTEQKGHSHELATYIQTSIRDNGGWIGFDHYMQMALYTPGLGYYSGGLAKFGEAGDFITAAEVGDLFGCCLANQVAEVLNHLGAGSVLEFGAGSGALAATMLKELDALGYLPQEYLILELSGALRTRQQATIKARAGEFYSRVRWLDELPKNFRGTVIANEVLDAMPVRLFEQLKSGTLLELGVANCEIDEPAFGWQTREAAPELAAAVKALNLTVDGDIYRSEISFQAPAWLESLGEVIEQGTVLLIDYGFRQSEYYHPDRAQGTLMCHYRHRVHDDPFFKPGLQDITAHVNFTAIAHAAQNAGFDLAGYATQGAYLLSTGLLDRIPLNGPVKDQLGLSQQVKKLTLPHEMGELFKVLALTKNYAKPLCGFEQQNHIHRL